MVGYEFCGCIFVVGEGVDIFVVGDFVFIDF